MYKSCTFKRHFWRVTQQIEELRKEVLKQIKKTQIKLRQISRHQYSTTSIRDKQNQLKSAELL